MIPDDRRVRILAGLVVAHVIVNGLHGLPHVSVPVPLATWQNAFVALVVLALPLFGLVLVTRGRIRGGGAAALVGGIGSAVFGTYYHFLSSTPDNVAQVTGPWWSVFLISAIGISLLAGAMAAAGGYVLVTATTDGT